ncbi:MAG: hypothetical protein Q8O67_29040 [Deltaproteobacteria bacterium]|nr:hypothetical protein [Deltaproteobacteria bacterium]
MRRREASMDWVCSWATINVQGPGGNARQPAEPCVHREGFGDGEYSPTDALLLPEGAPIATGKDLVTLRLSARDRSEQPRELWLRRDEKTGRWLIDNIRFSPNAPQGAEVTALCDLPASMGTTNPDAVAWSLEKDAGVRRSAAYAIVHAAPAQKRAVFEAIVYAYGIHDCAWLKAPWADEPTPAVAFQNAQKLYTDADLAKNSSSHFEFQQIREDFDVLCNEFNQDEPLCPPQRFDECGADGGAPVLEPGTGDHRRVTAGRVTRWMALREGIGWGVEHASCGEADPAWVALCDQPDTSFLDAGHPITRLLETRHVPAADRARMFDALARAWGVGACRATQAVKRPLRQPPSD